ncbi:NADPH oxidase homolog-like protein 1 [Teratosphaeria destructans]|uniref:NADPH oxidase homolog-like protein 1 n=1 Tax=Teratosphaeria destructans TaxID=418781 RepID=A0A9W7SVE0_9PEZI|nr:NADPH oxidase homolog-like protein 1 [Teratosphaeria destructans]
MTTRAFFGDVAAGSTLQPLHDDEINQFFDEIDQDRDGWINVDDLSMKLKAVHEELVPARKTKHDHLDRASRRSDAAWVDEEDVEWSAGRTYCQYRATREFLRAALPGVETSIDRAEFASIVRTWNVPSRQQPRVDKSQCPTSGQSRSTTWYRILRAHWSVEGPRIVFLFCVFCLILAFFLWQGLFYNSNTEARAAFGAGVVVAKFAAGSLYPVLALMLLSMSRWLSTWIRRSYWISKFVDWDYHKSFHLSMAWIGLFFATMHGIGHMSGSFLTASRPDRLQADVTLMGAQPGLSTYTTYLRLLPGWSGLIALGLYWTIALLALPQVRRWSYELFQAAHLLMFPFLGLLCIHGALKILQEPMLGFWLLIPSTLILFERCYRLARGFIGLEATVEILDEDTVSLAIKHPRGWYCQPGQYVLLQVPALSFWQWHPFTVSSCAGDRINLHIKTDGNWTSRLRDLPTDRYVKVGIDGPFGAPAQRFYDFDRAIIIGAGVGITPFSAIVTDMERHLSEKRDPWSMSGRSSMISPRSAKFAPVKFVDTDSASSRIGSTEISNHWARLLRQAQEKLDSRRNSALATRRRRVDFHWSVREERHLLWFSSLLNRAYDLAELIPRQDVELNINTHITAARKNISQHIFRYLLDAYRTPSSPVSALTGLKTVSQFGRPDYRQILEDFYAGEATKAALYAYDKGDQVGVFFCGNSKLGRDLSDICADLNVRARAEGTRMEFVFMTEVFG